MKKQRLKKLIVISLEFFLGIVFTIGSGSFFFYKRNLSLSETEIKSAISSYGPENFRQAVMVYIASQDNGTKNN